LLDACRAKIQNVIHILILALNKALLLVIRSKSTTTITYHAVPDSEVQKHELYNAELERVTLHQSLILLSSEFLIII